MSELRRVDEIKVEDRHRTDLGDLSELVASIKDVGLLNPIGITSSDRLIHGERRLEACKRLGLSRVAVTVATNLTQAADLLRAERDENLHRKDMTPSEKVALGRKLEELERPKAAERQKELGRTHGTPGENFSQGSKGKTGEIVGAAIGMSRPTYDRAKAVVRAAESGDPVAIEAMADMDRTGKVTAAYTKATGRSTTGNGNGNGPVYFGKGDKWQEVTQPLARYLAGWEKRGYEFAHINYREARKRVQVIDDLIEGLVAAKADLEPRSQKAKLTV